MKPSAIISITLLLVIGQMTLAKNVIQVEERTKAPLITKGMQFHRGHPDYFPPNPDEGEDYFNRFDEGRFDDRGVLGMDKGLLSFLGD